MKLAHFLGVVLVVAPIGLVAQNGGFGVAGMENMPLAGPGGKTAVTTPDIAAQNLCPVSMQASHLSDGSMLKTRADHPRGVGQRLRLKLTSPDQRAIASATVDLNGWTAKGRTEPLGQAGSSADLAPGVRTLTVPFAPDTDRTASADVWAPGLTAVVSVELLSVKYSDGSTWTPAQGKTCRVTPEHLMLITQR